ncbi:hypothetical protein NHQ30_011266 [Ciborinia camelliae]|nr:hypothetical protein NHQ30_011266 [Ciborinia camelliae]
MRMGSPTEFYYPENPAGNHPVGLAIDGNVRLNDGNENINEEESELIERFEQVLGDGLDDKAMILEEEEDDGWITV